MKIIVIIVTYNGIKWYDKCFDSLRNSTIPLDTVVIDNASTDDTVNFIKENYPEIHLIESKENLGFGKANNLGFEYAIEKDADYVFLLNQDAWIMSDTIEKLCNQMEKNPEYGILSPIHLNGTEKELDYYFSNYINAEDCPDLISDFIAKGKAEDRIYPINFVNAALWLISRDCLNKIDGFCPLFPHYGEDNNYLHRLTYHKMKVGIYPHVFGVHDRLNILTKTYKRNAYWAYSSMLILLCNINFSFISCLLVFLKRNFIALVTGKITLSHLKPLLIILTIIKHRKIAKRRFNF
jgi:GT2 family glycosyltransferase